MPTLETTINGITFPNPFLIASGPPGTNGAVIAKALNEGWGGVVVKTMCLDAGTINNVWPRYSRLRAESSREIIGWENIELISDRSFDTWIEELDALKQSHPTGIVIGSIMEELNRDRWHEIVERTQATGVAALELNFSCPHGLPERAMGSAMGQDPELLHRVCGWVKEVAKVPVWAKLTPNVTSIANCARAALSAGIEGISAINTILSVMRVNLDTLRPEPTVEGYSTPGGYSSVAVRPIALRMAKEIAEVIRDEFPNATLSGIGGIEAGTDAAQFILLGSGTTQVCTGVMKHGYGMVSKMKDELLAFMAEKKFETLEAFRGHSLQYFTTHADLYQRQQAAKRTRQTTIKTDANWTGDKLVSESESLVSGS